jgi:choline kinase
MNTKDLFTQVQEELHYLHQQTTEGEISNLDALIKMRQAKQDAEKVLEIVKDFENDRLQEISNEAESYDGKYQGFEIKQINGRKLYDFSTCPIVKEREQAKKDAEEFYKSGFEGYQKGVVQAKEVDGVLHWIDVDGDLQPFPILNIGKSFLQVKESKK